MFNKITYLHCRTNVFKMFFRVFQIFRLKKNMFLNVFFLILKSVFFYTMPVSAARSVAAVANDSFVRPLKQNPLTQKYNDVNAKS